MYSHHTDDTTYPTLCGYVLVLPEAVVSGVNANVEKFCKTTRVR